MQILRVTFSAVLLHVTPAVSAGTVGSLEASFLSPPASAKPRAWWEWMDDNVTQKGITADLEAMKQVGLGGATIVNLDCGIPRGNVPFLGNEWQKDFKFAVSEASRLDLKLGVADGAGWSNSGGPWNTVTNSMKCLTYSEKHVQGPGIFNALLSQPPVTLGFYRDIAVVAFREIPQASSTMLNIPPVSKTAKEKLEIRDAFYEAADGARDADGGGSADVTANIIDLLKSGRKSIGANSWELGCDPAVGQVKRLRVDFTLDGVPGSMTIGESGTLVFPENLSELAVATAREKHDLVDRTFVRPPPASDSGNGLPIPLDSIIDLTGNRGADGRLTWKIPPGDWIILRVGYTATGVNNHPATPEATGLECDKLDKIGMDGQWAGFVQKVLDDVGPLAGTTLDSSLIDSYEVGNQDWSENFREEFQKRRGYDPVEFLPTFTRRTVESPEVTERFLWDMRRTISDLFAENYYGRFAELCRAHHLASEVEPYYGPYESLQCGAPVQVAMGECWAGSHGHPSIKMAASIAHIYGKKIVGAESFTATSDAGGRWQNDPYSLKILGDWMFCKGVNRYSFHRYAMQPWTNRLPGMTMGGYGINFERTETWWKQAKAWIDYISRCEFLLQQGHAVEDVAYFDGQSTPVDMRTGNPPMPAGYDYDVVDADVLMHGATVKNDRILLASGANYGVLVLPPNDSNMTPPMLRSIRKLVRAGATVIGARPQRSPSLDDYPECDEQVKRMADELWGKCNGKTILENSDGRGRIVWGKSLSDVLTEGVLKPDFEFHGASTTDLAYTHRIAGDTDIYFISNQRQQFDSAECTFRVSGKCPELWHADTGLIEPAPIWSANARCTTMRLDFDPAGSVFVVFRHAIDSRAHFTVSGTSFAGDPVSAQKLEILHAIYTAVDGAGEIDVTAKVSGMVHDGQLALRVSNGTFDNDPAPGRVKQLCLDSTINGILRHKVIGEGQELALFSVGQLPKWQPSITTNGFLVIKAWENGRINLKTNRGKLLHVDVTNLPAPKTITGPWKLSFPSGWGTPQSVMLRELVSWSEYPNDGVRFFSGTATYEKDIDISADRLRAGHEVWLDLGIVNNLVQVFLNGDDLGVFWKPPFCINLTHAAKAGANQLVLRVTNLWPNRLIGDEHLPVDADWDGSQLKEWPQWLLDGKRSPTGRYTFATWRFYTKNSPLFESGLLGPVVLYDVESIPAI